MGINMRKKSNNWKSTAGFVSLSCTCN